MIFFSRFLTTILLFAIAIVPKTAVAVDIHAANEIYNACGGYGYVTKECINACVNFGIEDPLSYPDDSNNALNITCHYVLATYEAHKMQFDTKTVIRLKCDKEQPPKFCNGGGFLVAVFPDGQEKDNWFESVAFLWDSSSGKITRLGACGDCYVFGWESGFFKKAVLQPYDGGLMLYLNGTSTLKLKKTLKTD